MSLFHCMVLVFKRKFRKTGWTKTVRIFTCRDCGHKMRFGRSVCGACYSEKSFYQKPFFVFMVLSLVVFVSIAVALP